MGFENERNRRRDAITDLGLAFGSRMGDRRVILYADDLAEFSATIVEDATIALRKTSERMPPLSAVIGACQRLRGEREPGLAPSTQAVAARRAELHHLLGDWLDRSRPKQSAEMLRQKLLDWSADPSLCETTQDGAARLVEMPAAKLKFWTLEALAEVITQHHVRDETQEERRTRYAALRASGRQIALRDHLANLDAWEGETGHRSPWRTAASSKIAEALLGAGAQQPRR